MHTSTITPEQQAAIAALLEKMTLPKGIGTKESACSIAAINLALTGKLTDKIPDCMSIVIGQWIIRVQDRMPTNIRNSSEWKRLLPFAAGTGQDHEKQRAKIILDHMWEVVLPILQPLADKRGFGKEWRAMTTEKTRNSALKARAAASAAAASAAAASAAYAYDADADDAAAYADAAAASAAAASAAYAYDADDGDAADAAFWATHAPSALLEKLIFIDEAKYKPLEKE